MLYYIIMTRAMMVGRCSKITVGAVRLHQIYREHSGGRIVYIKGKLAFLGVSRYTWEWRI